MKHTGLTVATAAAGAVLLLAGCKDTAGVGPKAGINVTAPSVSATTSVQGATTPAAPTTPPGPAMTPRTGAPNAQVLQPQNGYVFIVTKSGKTRCQVSAEQVGCESDFANAPQINGESANGVQVTSAGELRWIVGNLGDIPTVSLDDRSYSALGWTIAPSAGGTRFTNQTSGHGMYISAAEVKAF